MPRAQIEAYARAHGLEWVEDESNANEALTRNFVRRQIGPLLDERFPGWKQSLGRAARHFSRKEAGAEALLRTFLRAKGLRAPSEARLVEMLKQLTSRGARTLIEHDGVRLRVYRGKILEDSGVRAFTPISWKGERRLAIPELGGELRFRRASGKGIAADAKPLQVRVRQGGERLQLDPRRPRRTLKNLFQEAGVPPWERDRLPLLARGDDVVWVPGLGVDVRYQAAKNAPGVLPEWRKMAG
jgi:tRNA(Ile)-lysidine synthase